MNRRELAIEKRLVVLRRAEQVAVEAREVARDALPRHDAFDAIDRGRMLSAARREPRSP
jgi:hypothetical protein